MLFYALTTLPLRPCHVHGTLSTTLPRLCYDYGTSMPRWRRLHYSLNMFCRCLPRPCTITVGSHCVFVTSRDLSITTRFNFSDTRFCFNNDIVNIIEPRHEIPNNVVCATSKGSDQPAHTRSLLRAFACRLYILRVLSY